MRQVITLAMTGASGVPYGLRLLECLLKADKHVYFTVSKAAQAVMALECEHALPTQPAALRDYLCESYGVSTQQLDVLTDKQWNAPIASGSSVPDAMVICPCSSGCVAAIAAGMSDNLIERAADVMIKENRPLILVHREMPLSAIHLENLLKLARLGVTIFPASPGFYHHPQTINDLVDFVVARVLDHLKIPQTLIKPWGTL